MKKTTRRVMALFFTLILCFAMVGCGLPFGSSSSGGGRAVAGPPHAEEDETESEEIESEEIESEEIQEDEKNGSEDNENDEDTSTEVASQEPDFGKYDAELPDDVYSFTFALNGAVCQLPMWFKDFESQGWEFQEERDHEIASNNYLIAQVWEKDGVSIFTDIANLTPNSAMLEECLVSSVTMYEYGFAEGAVIEFPGDIFVGKSTKEDIILAYGEPTEVRDSKYFEILTYEKDTYEYIEFSISKEKGVLTEFEFQNMIAIEGGNDTITTEVPDAVVNYEVPAVLSDKIYDKQFKLDEVIYTMPCPLAYMLEHGFEIDEEYLETPMGGGQTAVVSLAYGDTTMICTMSNKEDYGTTLRNCWVDSVKFNCYTMEGNIEFSGGITFDMTEDDFLALLEGYEYEKSEGYDHYYIYAPGEEDHEGYVFVSLDEGKVISVEMKVY